MSITLVKQILCNTFWDYPAYVPRPEWEYLRLDVREMKFLNIMRSTAQVPALPIPRFFQGLQFDIMDYEIGNGPGTCTAHTDKTSSINFENCHPFVNC